MADYARAELLRELRAASHLSQEDAAHEIGVSTKTLRTWEAGGKIRWGNAQKLAAFYAEKVKPDLTAEEIVSRELVEPTPVVGLSQLDRIEERQIRIEAMVTLIAQAIPAPKTKAAKDNLERMFEGIWGELSDQPAPMNG